MLFSFVDMYHLTTYFTSKKRNVCCTDESRSAIDSISNCPYGDGQKTKFPPLAKMLKSTMQV